MQILGLQDLRWVTTLRTARIEGVFVEEDSAFGSRAFVVFFLIRLWVCKISHVDYHNLHALPQKGEWEGISICAVSNSTKCKKQRTELCGTGQQNDNRYEMSQIWLTRSAWLEVQADPCEKDGRSSQHLQLQSTFILMRCN